MTTATTEPLSSAAAIALLTTEEVARVLRVDSSTLRRWRTASPVQGPPFIPMSDRVVMYHADDVMAWLRSRRVSTGEVAA
ncbi:helix-turn-helix domain-containing protein [Actinocatenispora sera]|uniref:helix-turn-helix transcriptional regulator n=1 Tax=Actinocatenispora sera TaxID=390989 RepID=UPI0033ED7A39